MRSHQRVNKEMTGEIITLEVGQCGNQVGQQFWSQLAKEHGIGMDGLGIEATDNGTSSISEFRDDNTLPFFKNNDKNRYTPRALLIDLEPKVINDTMNTFPGFFDPRNYWVSQERYGAGNSWANGFSEGEKNHETFINMIDKELDSTENFEGFQLFHSVAGGTGSGLGSNLLEIIADRYPKNFITTYSVFPTDQSEVVVQPYNTILTLRRLVEESDASIIFDNSAILNLSSKVFRKNNVDFSDSNQLIAATMSAITNSIRFPSYMYTSLQSIFSTLIPTPDLHFLTSAFTPFTHDYVEQSKEYRQNTTYDVILDLVDPQNSLVSFESRRPTYFNIFNTIIGNEIDRNDITRASLKIQQRLQFASWSASCIHINQGKRSQWLNQRDSRSGSSQYHNEYINGMSLVNSTGIVPLLANACEQFDKIFAKKAFINAFRQINLFANDDTEFIDSQSVVQDVIEEYVNAEDKEYLDDVLIEEENIAGDMANVSPMDADGDNVLI